MAKDDDKTVVRPSEEPESNAGDAKSSGAMKKMLMFGGIGAGAVVVGVALALFVLKPMMSGSRAEGETAGQVEQTDDSHATASKNAEHTEQPKQKKKPRGHGSNEGDVGNIIYAVKDIVINPAGTGGTRYLSVSFGFELESDVLATEFEEREMVVRDALITILSSKTVAQLTDPKQKEIVRYQVKKRLEQLLDTDELAGVYYTDFVLQ